MTRAAQIRRAAAVYQRAYDRGDAPTVAVADALGVTYYAAAKLVTQARIAELLPPSNGHRPAAEGEFVSGKVRAVANAVKVDPVVLRDAIVKHANGDLRVRR